MLIGIHTSIQNGYAASIIEGEECGAEVVQIFVRPNLTWKKREILENEIIEFRKALHSSKFVKKIIAHSSYLINLASDDNTTIKRSISLITEELKLCSLLGIDIYVIHPGSHKGRGVKIGINQIIEGLSKVREKSGKLLVRVAFETTAGSGNQMGSNIEELSELIERTRQYFDSALCIDTAHLFSSGYNITDDEEYEKLINRIDKNIGLKKLLVCHMNDSKAGLGSKKDRHEHIGRGMINLSVFRKILKDKRLNSALAILETPKEVRDEDGESYDKLNIEILKRLRDE